MIQKITAWSFSRLQDYRSCPLKAKYKHIDKIREPGNAAMDRGIAIDKVEGDFITGKLQQCPPEIKSFEVEFLELRKRKAIVQDQWAFDKDWMEVDWFDKAAWCRIKTDVYTHDLKTNTMLLVDCKTGKIREEHKEQVKLYALGGLMKLPTVDIVDARLWYTDQAVELPEKPELYTRADIPALKIYWLKETKAMLADTRFAPKPGYGCKYCFFSKAKGGPCQY